MIDWKRNQLGFGLVLALVMPIMLYGILLAVYDLLDDQGWLTSAGLSTNFRDRTLGLVALCVNLYLLQQFRKHHATQAMRGVVLATMVYVILWMVVYGIKLI